MRRSAGIPARSMIAAARAWPTPGSARTTWATFVLRARSSSRPGQQLFSFIKPLTYPASLAGIVAGIWLVIGAVYLVYLMRRHPDWVTDTERVFIDDLAGQAGPEPALPPAAGAVEG